MYNSIVITNPINCRNKNITYKFTLILDIINWQTTASLKVLDNEYISILPGDLFSKVQNKIASLLDIPHDDNGKVYEGPEIKIKLADKFGYIEWSNMTSINCDNEKAFKIPHLYALPQHQDIYDNATTFLVQLSDNIFGDKIQKN
jgi:hypothetical protein